MRIRGHWEGLFTQLGGLVSIGRKKNSRETASPTGTALVTSIRWRGTKAEPFGGGGKVVLSGKYQKDEGKSK